MSPDFTGISSSFREVTYQGTDSILKLAVGGGFVETYAFGGAAPDQEETGAFLKIRDCWHSFNGGSICWQLRVSMRSESKQN